MVADHEWFSPTRMVGLTVYAASCTACAAKYVSCLKSGRRGRLFTLLAVVQLFLLLDMAFNWRWKIHEFFGQGAMNRGVYAERRPPQAIALSVLFAVLVIATIWIYRKFSERPGLATALTGTMLSVGLTCCEGISYHYVDLVFYRMVGNLMVVSLVWIGLAVVTCSGVLLDHRSRPRS